MIDLKKFRADNHLSQVDLAKYLEVGQGFISQIENGARPMPESFISKIKSNKGWILNDIYASSIEVSAGDANINISNKQISLLQAKIEMLEQQLAEEKARSTEYWNLLKDAISRSRG